MSKTILYQDTHITITYVETIDCIYADWTGYQTKQSVQEGCERILDELSERECRKVLNDNTNVEGIWSSAAEWVGVDWLPRMRQAGMDYFAWVYSPSAFSRLSADKSLRFTHDMRGIEVFDSVADAENWLLKAK
ncbi:hypothetical protein [Rufibacter roseus]|uniref:STAS/SEC14 domain-containing protein n=1 Tax=Rufibacter roseus TaxID=1567108 RepID=A0ABW2DKS1_9BACT|nr:hypothetical protein [Rufibacter roseus]